MSLNEKIVTVDAKTDEKIIGELCKACEDTGYMDGALHRDSKGVQFIAGAIEPQNGENLLQQLSGGKFAWQEADPKRPRQWFSDNEETLRQIARSVQERVEDFANTKPDIQKCYVALFKVIAPKIRGLLIEKLVIEKYDWIEPVSEEMDVKGKVDMLALGQTTQMKSGFGSHTIGDVKADAIAVYHEPEGAPNGTFAVAFTESGTEVHGKKDDVMNPAYIRARDHRYDPMPDGWVSGAELKAD